MPTLVRPTTRRVIRLVDGSSSSIGISSIIRLSTAALPAAAGGQAVGNFDQSSGLVSAVTFYWQLLRTTSLEALELKITVRDPMDTGTVNASFTWNLARRSVHFRLIFLTQYKVIHCFNVLISSHWTRSATAWLSVNVTRLADFLQEVVDTFQFPTFVRNSFNSFRVPQPFDG